MSDAFNDFISYVYRCVCGKCKDTMADTILVGALQFRCCKEVKPACLKYEVTSLKYQLNSYFWSGLSWVVHNFCTYKISFFEDVQWNPHFLSARYLVHVL